MGKNNKARRAAKAKKRAKDRTSPGHGGGERRSSWSDHQDDGPSFTQREMTTYAIHLAARTIAEEGSATELLDHLASVESSVLCDAAEEVLSLQVAGCWDGGWQPAELVRQGRRDTATSAAARLVSLAVAVDHTGRRATSLDSRWMQQIDRLELPIVDAKPGWVRRWIADEALVRPKAVAAIVDAYRAVSFIPRLEPILPPPGSPDVGASGPTAHAGDGLSDPILDKIRNLLAKAESTDFEAEATAFTTKAQELMTRHAIDAASVERGPHNSTDQPIVIRLMIDPPYVDAKNFLLHVVAEANRSRSVQHSSLDLSTVVGFETDVAAVEILFTSLLVQAQTALADAARHAPAGTRVRSQAFRSSFLTAFAHRIGDRLDEINRHVYDEASAAGATGFELVLRDRSSAVDDTLDAIFGELTSSSVRRGHDAVGYAHGTVAANQARLTFGDLSDTATDADIDLREYAERVAGPIQSPLPLEA